jgi:hypothetical protein
MVTADGVLAAAVRGYKTRCGREKYHHSHLFDRSVIAMAPPIGTASAEYSDDDIQTCIDFWTEHMSAMGDGKNPKGATNVKLAKLLNNKITKGGPKTQASVLYKWGAVRDLSVHTRYFLMAWTSADEEDVRDRHVNRQLVRLHL